MFMSLMEYGKTFFSYYFNDDDLQQVYARKNIFDGNNSILHYDVNDPKIFNQFVKSRFMQRIHLEMILISNATRNGDRFNAILPSWHKYKHLIKNKDTVSEWNITDMTSVRLKLYEIMDDLWDKAKLLYLCSRSHDGPILPSFASHCIVDELTFIEKYDYDNTTYKEFEKDLLDRIGKYKGRKEEAQIKQLINEYIINSKSIWTENLANIQFKQQRCCLSVKSNSYFIRKYNTIFDVEYDSYQRNHIYSELSLDADDEIHCVFLPFFTLAVLDYVENPYLYTWGSNIGLVGNRHKNKWVLICKYFYSFKSEHFCSDSDYTFNIY
ncbi:unnamed protein product [Cunninghamella blakesleeana]